MSVIVGATLGATCGANEQPESISIVAAFRELVDDLSKTHNQLQVINRGMFGFETQLDKKCMVPPGNVEHNGFLPQLWEVRARLRLSAAPGIL
jgi:hypothetical protein